MFSTYNGSLTFQHRQGEGTIPSAALLRHFPPRQEVGPAFPVDLAPARRVLPARRQRERAGIAVQPVVRQEKHPGGRVANRFVETVHTNEHFKYWL